MNDDLEKKEVIPEENAPAESAETTETPPEEAKKPEKTVTKQSPLERLRGFLQSETVQKIGEVLVPVGGKIAYEKMFGRYERPDYSVTPGLRTYERVADRLPRQRFTFRSDDVECAGYFYPAKPSKGLVAFAHGLHAGADDYLSVFEFFVKNGYSVIAFDTKGTYDSKGNSTVGLSEALVELDHLLDLVKEEPTLSKFPLFVCGHSCGGGAVTAVLSLHPEIRGCTGIAAMKDANQMIVGKGFIYSSILGLPEQVMTTAFLESQQKKLFGDYTECNGVRGINDTTCPVLLAHGIKDLVIEYPSPISLISHKKELRKENVFYYTGMGNSVWRSAKAVSYQDQVKKELDKLKKAKGKEWTHDDEAAFCAGIDHDLYSAVNEELFEKALSTFEKA